MEDELANLAGPEALEQVRGVAKAFDKAEDLGARLGKHEQNLRNAILDAKRKKGEAAPPKKVAEPDVKTLVTRAGGRFEGMQEGIGEHPGRAMITEPTSGSSFLLPLGEITTANIKKGLTEVKRRFEAVAPIEIPPEVEPVTDIKLPMPSRAEVGTKRLDALVKKMEKLGFGKAVKEIQEALPVDTSVEFMTDNFRAALARFI